MTPLDEAPEQRWWRTVDRRNRPAKLQVDRLLRDFGYAELDPAAADAIEARLAGVGLAVAPSLRDTAANQVVTIYANANAPVAETAGANSDAGSVAPAPAVEPAVVADVAQMVTYLKQQVLDARSEAERLRTELDRRIASRTDAASGSQAIIAEQAAELEDRRRQIAELGAALDHTRKALAETRDEIRRAVGELQALPPIPADEPSTEFDDFDDEYSLSGEEPGNARDEAEAPAAAEANADADTELEEPAAAEPPVAVDVPAPDVPEPAPSDDLVIDLDEPPLGAREPDRDDLAEWQTAAAAPPPADGDPDQDLLTEFDDLLYDDDELYDPADGEGSVNDSPPAPVGLDDSGSTLPPPPPPSPFADGPEPAVPAAPAVHERATLGKVLRSRGRGGSGRGRWQGSCSICGRLPVENRRRDLEAAGWNLDDEAAACPQCRAIG